MNRHLTLSRLGILLAITATVLLTVSSEPCQARQTQTSEREVNAPAPPSGANTGKKSSGGGAVAAVFASLGVVLAASVVRRKRQRERDLAGKSN